MSDVVSVLLLRAEEDLASARYDLAGGFIRAALNRAYYAAFHAVQAALLTVGEAPRTHSGVLPQADSALLELGRHIAVLADAVQPAGTHTVTVDGARWPNGVYLYRLAAGEHLQTGHLVLAR
jgi:uncharacterized protein (UPF0332 family)